MANEFFILGGVGVVALALLLFFLTRKEEVDDGSYTISRVLPSPLPQNQGPTRVQLADGYVGLLSDKALTPLLSPNGHKSWLLSLDDDTVQVILPSKEEGVHVVPDDFWAVVTGNGRIYVNLTRRNEVVPWELTNFPKQMTLASQNRNLRLQVNNLEADLDKARRALAYYMREHRHIEKSAGVGEVRPAASEEEEEEKENG